MGFTQSLFGSVRLGGSSFAHCYTTTLNLAKDILALRA